MKVTVAYYLILLYVTVMLKPMLPIVSDTLSHTFYEAIHIATVHAIFGSNHLEKELSDTAPDNAGSKHQNVNLEDQVPFHVSVDTSHDGLTFNVADQFYSSLRLYKPKPGFILRNFPPPKFC